VSSSVPFCHIHLLADLNNSDSGRLLNCALSAINASYARERLERQIAFLIPVENIAFLEDHFKDNSRLRDVGLAMTGCLDLCF
jgi:hypothetical protein